MESKSVSSVFFLLCLLVGLLLAGCSEQEQPQADLDYQLLEAIREEELRKFKSLLKKGANPNAVFGPKPYDWVMCQVTKKKNSSLLQLVLDNGGDVGLRNKSDGVSLVYATPIFCALSLNFPNYSESVAVLLENGANPSVDACSGCEPYLGSKEWDRGPITNMRTAIMSAVSRRNWDAVVLILDRKIALEKELKLSWQEKNFIVYMIESAEERRYTDESNKKRVKVAERFITLGLEMTPSIGKENSRIKFPKWGEPAAW